MVDYANMSGMYADFTDDDSSGVLVEENNGIAWDEETAATEDQVVIGYDTINESFVSAVEDGSTTQYFSVMETSTETMLGDMSAITLDGDAKGTEFTTDGGDTGLEGEMMANIAGNDIMLYDVPGDGLYGIQLAEDEAGNLQKYQFKLRWEQK